ncbi:kinase-like domain [Cordyceps militaris]|uniref:Kinase-like domain n=1 Tax=Cordyceps militaris TaxID=73501 RepID=A0A2H4S698_CORMI|nr:kinase-like domain [Cordyceps militaris]
MQIHSRYSCKPFSRGQRLVFALESGESQRFAVRVDRNVSEFTRSMTEEEIEMLKSMRNLQLPHLPSLVHYELEPSPPLVVTNWVDGHELTWSDATPAPHVRRHVIRTIAEVTLDLLQIQRPGISALDWITGKITRSRVNRAAEGKLQGLSLSDAERLKSQIPDFHLPCFDQEPRVLVHGDLKASNIIMNGDKLARQVLASNVIDLGFAQLVPLQFATFYPAFLTNEPRRTGDTFDWSSCSYSERQMEDRKFFLQCIKDLAPIKGREADVYFEILARDDQETRHWWLSAVSRLDMMVALNSKP